MNENCRKMSRTNKKKLKKSLRNHKLANSLYHAEEKFKGGKFRIYVDIRCRKVEVPHMFDL